MNHALFSVLLRQEFLYSPSCPRRHVDEAGLKFAAVFYVFLLSIRIVGMNHSSQFCFFFFTPFFVLVCAGAFETWSVLSRVIWASTSPLRVTYLPGPSVPGVLEPVLGAAMSLTLCPFPSLPSWGHVPHPPSLPKSCGTVFALHHLQPLRAGACKAGHIPAAAVAKESPSQAYRPFTGAS